MGRGVWIVQLRTQRPSWLFRSIRRRRSKPTEPACYVPPDRTENEQNETTGSWFLWKRANELGVSKIPFIIRRGPQVSKHNYLRKSREEMCQKIRWVVVMNSICVIRCLCACLGSGFKHLFSLYNIIFSVEDFHFESQEISEKGESSTMK